MVLCDVCNHAIWKYPVWDCSRYFSILTGNVALSLAVHLVIQQTVAIVSGVTFRWWWS